MAILTENREYPKLVTELLRLEEKRYVQGVCYFINKFPKLILKNKKEVYIQNINNLFLELRVILKKTRSGHCDRIRCL
jgi:hypothetical protein